MRHLRLSGERCGRKGGNFTNHHTNRHHHHHHHRYKMLPQRRVQLRAKDLKGRTILTHAIRSGHVQLFDAVLTAVRHDVLESEVRRAGGRGWRAYGFFLPC